MDGDAPDASIANLFTTLAPEGKPYFWKPPAFLKLDKNTTVPAAMDDFTNRSLPITFGPPASNRCRSGSLSLMAFGPAILSYLTVTDFARFLG